MNNRKERIFASREKNQCSFKVFYTGRFRESKVRRGRKSKGIRGEWRFIWKGWLILCEVWWMVGRMALFKDAGCWMNGGLDEKWNGRKCGVGLNAGRWNEHLLSKQGRDTVVVARELDARNFNLRAWNSTLFTDNVYNVFSLGSFSYFISINSIGGNEILTYFEYSTLPLLSSSKIISFL